MAAVRDSAQKPQRARPIDDNNGLTLSALIMSDERQNLADLSDRSREVFRRVVESYLDSGEPVGSRTLSRSMSEQISAATIRNVMQDLEQLGLLNSPHVSAGRIPTQAGLRLFVDGLLEVGELSDLDRERIDKTRGANEGDVATLLSRIGTALSGATRSASIVLVPKHEAPVRHVEFVSLSPERALAILVFANGSVENRVFSLPPGQTPASLREAANFVSAVAEGRTLSELSAAMSKEIGERRRELDALARNLVEAGKAIWENEGESHERLIVRGRANLLSDSPEDEDLEKIKILFDDLERKRDIVEFLDLTKAADGVRIFIGSENKLFSLSGSSVVVSPYMDSDRKIIGAVGVIGPTRINYGRIVPIVDYTAQVIGKLLSDRG